VLRRRVGYPSLGLALALLVAASAVSTLSAFGDATVGEFALTYVVSRGLTVVATALVVAGAYLVVERAAAARLDSKRRAHDVRNVLRLTFGLVGVVAVLGVATDQWVGLLFSLGIVGFAVTFALQQPLLSFVGWFYVMLKRPFSVGDRVEIDETRGDLDVNAEPTVNVVQEESWLTLRLRFLSHPRQITRNQNALYEEIVARFNEEPDRVQFPLGRNR
jgi:small-conductance mechanosensitive channel